MALYQQGRSQHQPGVTSETTRKLWLDAITWKYDFIQQYKKWCFQFAEAVIIRIALREQDVSGKNDLIVVNAPYSPVLPRFSTGMTPFRSKHDNSPIPLSNRRTIDTTTQFVYNENELRVRKRERGGLYAIAKIAQALHKTGPVSNFFDDAHDYSCHFRKFVGNGSARARVVAMQSDY